MQRRFWWKNAKKRRKKLEIVPEVSKNVFFTPELHLDPIWNRFRSNEFQKMKILCHLHIRTFWTPPLYVPKPVQKPSTTHTLYQGGGPKFTFCEIVNNTSNMWVFRDFTILRAFEVIFRPKYIRLYTLIYCPNFAQHVKASLGSKYACLDAIWVGPKPLFQGEKWSFFELRCSDFGPNVLPFKSS